VFCYTSSVRVFIVLYSRCRCMRDVVHWVYVCVMCCTPGVCILWCFTLCASVCIVMYTVCMCT